MSKKGFCASLIFPSQPFFKEKFAQVTPSRECWEWIRIFFPIKENEIKSAILLIKVIISYNDF